MAKKKEASKEILELKKEMAEGKAVIGTKEVLAELREEKLGRIYLASNCPAERKEEIKHYAALVKVPVVELEISNEEIGILGKKHYFVAAVGVKKK